MVVVFDDIAITVRKLRVGYRTNYSHLAVERALQTLKFWQNLAEHNATKHPKTSLNYKARGIVSHDRLLNSLY